MMANETYALSTDAAEFYESTFVPALFGELAARLVAFAKPAPGQAVLDVACGTGIVARTAAERLNETDTVVGVDLNESMLAVARRLRPDIEWRLADAATLPFDDGSFDVVFCQAALMFFADPVAALREMARVAGRTGLVAVLVPGRLRESAGYLALTKAAARHGGPEVVDLLQSYFAVGEPDRLAVLFATAGLAFERMQTWFGATRLDSIESFLGAELLPLAGTVDEATRARIAEDCRIALAEFVDQPSGAIAAPIEAHIIIARPDSDPGWTVGGL